MSKNIGEKPGNPFFPNTKGNNEFERFIFIKVEEVDGDISDPFILGIKHLIKWFKFVGKIIIPVDPKMQNFKRIFEVSQGFIDYNR